MAASFHAYVCMIQWLACLTGFIYGLTESGKEKMPWLWYTSLLGVFAMPIVNELFLCVKGCLLRSSVSKPSPAFLEQLDRCVPIVYSTGYNIHAFGAEKLHPFDASKYRRVFADLLESRTVDPERK